MFAHRLAVVALVPVFYGPQSLAQSAPDLSGLWDSTWSPRTAEELEVAPAKLTAEGERMMADFDPVDDPAVRCEHPGLIRQVITPYPIRIDQDDDRITIWYEEWWVARLIPLGSSSEDGPPSAMGHPAGRFEGSTLVIETTGLSRGLAMLPRFLWTSDQATVVERYYVGDDGNLHQEMTLTDPVMLEEPWITRQTYSPYDVDLLPFECELRERPPA